MDIFKTLDLFMLYTGLDRDEAAKWLPLIASSKAAITNRLKKSETEENADRIAEAAAALAFYRFVLTEESSLSGSFSAGSVSVTNGGKERINTAKANLETVLDSVSDLLCDDDFAFVGVRA
ncbi:MAG: hypothetical protein ACI4QV_03095 [Acutalibacteraceae bacterium]